MNLTDMVKWWGQTGEIMNGHNVKMISPGYKKIAWALWCQHDLDWFQKTYKGKPELGIGIMDWAYQEPKWSCDNPKYPMTNIPNKSPPSPPPTPRPPPSPPTPSGGGGDACQNGCTTCGGQGAWSSECKDVSEAVCASWNPQYKWCGK